MKNEEFATALLLEEFAVAVLLEEFATALLGSEFGTAVLVDSLIHIHSIQFINFLFDVVILFYCFN